MARLFKKQIDAVQDRKDGDFVFSEEYKNSSSCRYWTGTIKQLFNLIISKKPEDRHFFELLITDYPLHLYFDIDCKRKFRPGIVDDELTLEILSDLKEFLLYDKYADSEEEIKIIPLDSSSDIKYSSHFIVKIKGKMFKSYEHCKVAAESFEERYRDKYLLEDDSGKQFSMIDISVYSRNRNFRLPGCSKSIKKEILKPFGHSGNFVLKSENYDFFVDCLIMNANNEKVDLITLEIPEVQPSKKAKLCRASSSLCLSNELSSIFERLWHPGCNATIKTIDPHNSKIIFDSRSHQCKIGGKSHEHANQHVFFELYYSNKYFIQRCYPSNQGCNKKKINELERFFLDEHSIEVLENFIDNNNKKIRKLFELREEFNRLVEVVNIEFLNQN